MPEKKYSGFFVFCTFVIRNYLFKKKIMDSYRHKGNIEVKLEDAKNTLIILTRHIEDGKTITPEYLKSCLAKVIDDIEKGLFFLEIS